jgi:hypothetical protein
MSTSGDWEVKRRREEQERAARGKEYLTGLVPMLCEAGAAKLVIHYNGENDDGEIESVEIYAKEGEEQSVAVAGLDEDNIGQAAIDVLGGLGIDWYNDNGAYGCVTVTVSTGKIAVENNERFKDSTYSEHEV